MSRLGEAFIVALISMSTMCLGYFMHKRNALLEYRDNTDICAREIAADQAKIEEYGTMLSTCVSSDQIVEILNNNVNACAVRKLLGE